MGSRNISEVRQFNKLIVMKREISYFRSVLEQYLNDHHPDRMKDASFIKSRAEEASGVYADAVRNGSPYPEAENLASETLYKGLHFSAYDMIVEVLWNEFSDTIPQELAERLAAILLGNTAVRKLLAKYKTDDSFDGTPEYDLLYTELTGTIRLVIERNGLPVLKARH